MLSRIVLLLSLFCVCVLSELFTNDSCHEVTECAARHGKVIPLLRANRLDCKGYPVYLKCVSDALGPCWNTTLNITALALKDATAGNGTATTLKTGNATVTSKDGNATVTSKTGNATVTSKTGNDSATTKAENTKVIQSTVDALVSARNAFTELCGNKTDIVDVPINNRDTFSRTYVSETYVVNYSDLDTLHNSSKDCKKLAECTSILKEYTSNLTSEFPCNVIVPFGDCYQENRKACEVVLEKLDESTGNAVQECEVSSASSTYVGFLLLLGAVLWQRICV